MEPSKGRNYLYLCGLLMAAGGIISIIIGLFKLVGCMACGCVAVQAGANEGLVTAIVIIAGILALAGGVLQLIAGIQGVRYSDVPEKAGTCIAWGIIVLIIQVIGLIVNLSGSDSSAFVIILTIIFSIAVPVLYLVGAFKNRSQRG